MKKEQETSEEKNEVIADSTDKATAPSTAFPDLTEKHPCPHRYCALLEELKTTPDLYDLLHSYCTFPESEYAARTEYFQYKTSSAIPAASSPSFAE